jgi:hypothetical protein
METNRVKRAREKLLCEFGSTCRNSVKLQNTTREKAKRRDSFWAVPPFLIVVTVLTPATTWTEGFTNRLIVPDYSENYRPWQPKEKKKSPETWTKFLLANVRNDKGRRG